MMLTSPHADAASPARYIPPPAIPAAEIDALAEKVAAYCARHEINHWRSAQKTSIWLEAAADTGSFDRQARCLRRALIALRQVARQLRRRAAR